MAKAALADFPVYLSAIGTVQPVVVATVRPQLAGTLFSIDFKAGQIPAGPKGDKGNKGDKGDKGDPASTGAHAVFELLDDQRAIVGMRVIPVLVLELGRCHQVAPQFRRVARAGELRADDILALGVAVEQQPIGPDDVLSREPDRVIDLLVILEHRLHPTLPPGLCCMAPAASRESSRWPFSSSASGLVAPPFHGRV